MLGTSAFPLVQYGCDVPDVADAVDAECSSVVDADSLVSSVQTQACLLDVRACDPLRPYLAAGAADVVGVEIAVGVGV